MIPNPLPVSNVTEFVFRLLAGSPQESFQDISWALDHVIMALILWVLIRYFTREVWYGK
jgi:hypothetical protein